MNSTNRTTVSEYTVNSGPEAQCLDYDIVCPQIPSNGRPNMHKRSCEWRRGQEARRERKTACSRWPNCGEAVSAGEDMKRKTRSGLTAIVGKALLARRSYAQIAQEYDMSNTKISKHRAIIIANPDLYPDIDLKSHDGRKTVIPHPEATENAKAVAAKMVELHKAGHTREEIARKVNRSKQTISKRLREAGFLTQRRQGTLREEILTHLEKHPKTPIRKIQEIFGCARSTAEGYKAEFGRGKRAVYGEKR